MEEGGGQNEIITAEEMEETEKILLFGNESEFIMSPEYSKNSKARHYREQALDYYQGIYNHQNGDVLVPYVAMNFFDRVISKLKAPPVLLNKQENFSLFLISCHSISWKLRENNFDIYNFLLDRKMKFGNKGLMRMEMSILQALDWRTKQTVPFRFVPYFLHILTLPRGFTRLPVLKIIVWTQADIRFTKFRPSAVAASAILCASAKLFPDGSNDFTSVILTKYAHFDSTIKDELAECVEMIQRTYQNKMNTLVIAKGSINDGAGTSQPLSLAPEEASTVPAGSGKESVEEGSQRHGKETVSEEANKAVIGIQTMPEQSSSPADGQESLGEGAQKQGKESVAEEASTAVGDIQTAPKQSSSPGDGRESPVKRSHRPGKEPIYEESNKAIGKIEMAPEQSSSPADGQESLGEGAQKQGKESVAEEASTAVGDIQTAPKQSSSPGDGRESPVKRSHRPGKEPIYEESNKAIGKIEMAPEQSSSPADGQESLGEGAQKQGKESVAEEASTAVGDIQTAPKQSSNPGDGRESPVKRSHRPGKEPIYEESNKAIGKIQMAPEQSSYTSDDDTEEVEEGFCRPEKVRMVEMEEPELAVVDNLLMNFELGWDDQNPYSHGYGMCSLCDALARCWPIPIFEAQEQTFEWLSDSWEWLLNLPEHIGIPNRQAARRPWESYHEADSKSSSDPESYRIQDFFKR